MLQLHYYPGNASLAPHILLHEMGLPFELKRVDRDRGEHKSPEYLKLNPNGLIPVLVEGDFVLYESAAICLHLVDTNPEHELAPPLGTRERAQFYKWLVWMTNTLQPALIRYYYPERLVDPGNSEGAAQAKRQAEAAVGPMLDQVEAQLASHGGPWLLGERYSACDPYAWMLERPAVQRVIAAEQLSQPLV